MSASVFSSGFLTAALATELGMCLVAQGYSILVDLVEISSVFHVAILSQASLVFSIQFE